MSKTGLLITARLKSSRLPLKILNDLGGSEIIAQVIKRAKQVHGVDEVVLCTSTNPQDAPLARIALREQVPYFLGDEADVLRRLRDASIYFGIDSIISITADNPFFCIHHANRVSDTLRKKPKPDYIHINGLPIGAAVYGISRLALEVACEVKQEADTEIWGPFVNRPDIFRVVQIDATDGYQIDARLTIDEPLDYAFALAIAKHSCQNVSHITVPEIASIIKAIPDIKKINHNVSQRPLDPGIANEINNLFVQKFSHIKSLVESYRRSEL